MVCWVDWPAAEPTPPIEPSASPVATTRPWPLDIALVATVRSKLKSEYTPEPEVVRAASPASAPPVDAKPDKVKFEVDAEGFTFELTPS